MEQLNQLKSMREDALERLANNPDFKLVSSLENLIRDLEASLGESGVAAKNEPAKASPKVEAKSATVSKPRSRAPSKPKVKAPASKSAEKTAPKKQTKPSQPKQVEKQVAKKPAAKKVASKKPAALADKKVAPVQKKTVVSKPASAKPKTRATSAKPLPTAVVVEHNVEAKEKQPATIVKPKAEVKKSTPRVAVTKPKQAPMPPPPPKLAVKTDEPPITIAPEIKSETKVEPKKAAEASEKLSSVYLSTVKKQEAVGGSQHTFPGTVKNTFRSGISSPSIPLN